MRQAVRRPLQTKPSLTSRITRGICVACFVLCLIVASLMALSLISYSPDDPAWSKAVQTETISNWLGIRGAYFADIVFVALGNSSWILLIALILFAHQLFYKGKVFVLTFELFLIRFTGMLFVIATLSGFFSVYGITDIHNDLQINNTNGGILGHWIGAKFTLFSFSWIELITGQSFSAISASLIFLGFLLIISLILASGKTPLYWLEVSGKLIIATIYWIFNKVPTSTQSNDNPSQEKSALALVEHLMEHQNPSESKSLLSKLMFFKAKTPQEDHSIIPKEPTIQEPLIQQNNGHVIQSEMTSIGQLLAQQKLQTKTDRTLDPEPFKILQPAPFIMPDRETVDAMPSDQVNKIPTVMQMFVRPKINERAQESEDRSQFESVSPFTDSPFHEEAVAKPEINEREQITNKVLELSDWVNNAKNMMESHNDKLEAPVEKSAAPFSFPMTFNEFNNDQEPSFDSFFNEPNKPKPTLKNRDRPLKDNDDDLLQSLDRLLNPPQEEKTANLTRHSELPKTYFDDEPEEAELTFDFNLNFDSPTRNRTATVQTTIEPRGMAIDPRSGMPIPQKAVPHFPMAGQLPNLNLLGDPPPCKASYNASELNEMAQLIEEQLKHFGISVTVANIEPGPVITRFELELAPGVKVAQINNLSKDIARAMSVTSVRVVDIIPGKTYVGLEIPNARREIVYFKEGLASNEYIESDHPLTIILGKDIAGETLIANLGKMPHLLVAGTTGSGKSVGVNTMLLSLLFKATPEEVRLILIDPKMLELSVYNDIPHLLTPVVTDMKESANALRWCVAEMERRYLLMSQLKVRNIEGFNKKVNNAIAAGNPLKDPLWRRQDQVSDTITHPTLKPLPFIVVVIDEFADMMMLVGKKCEELIARLAQKARASGIHLILATQRPSVDVITGLIKANIPTRIAFQVSSRIDSRTIIDQQGAETLLGHGDMLYLPPGVGIPIRVHGAFVDDHEVNKIVEFLKLTGEPDYIEDILNEPIEPIPGLTPEASGVALPPSDSEDALFDEAVKVVIESQRASISYVQRKLRVGYQRAARLIEEMEAQGIISAPLTNGSREVLAKSSAMDDEAFD